MWSNLPHRVSGVAFKAFTLSVGMARAATHRHAAPLHLCNIDTY